MLLQGGGLFARLTRPQCHQLHQLVEWFLQEKNLDPVGGLVLDETRRLMLAAQACLPVLHLGLDYYDNWMTLIVYPKSFVPDHEEMDPAGVIHPSQPRVGESWPDGPVILSWKDVERDFMGKGNDYPQNVVIHEMAHQLDGRSGGFDGMPPLHPEMNAQRWIRDFSAAYEWLQQAVDSRQETFLDPYACESPAEFFAVACETFFVAPKALQAGYPKVYAQLSGYFRQSPLVERSG